MFHFSYAFEKIKLSYKSWRFSSSADAVSADKLESEGSESDVPTMDESVSEAVSGVAAAGELLTSFAGTVSEEELVFEPQAAAENTREHVNNSNKHFLFIIKT